MTLTQRQIEVIRGVAFGKTRKEIALDLGIDHHTVDGHLSTIELKLGFKDPARIALFAARCELIELYEPDYQI